MKALYLLILISMNLHSSDLRPFNAIYNYCYQHCYIRSQCHQNIFHFLSKANNNKLNLNHAFYWLIRPKKGGYFNMINAYETRNKIMHQDQGLQSWMPTDNWFHHGIVVIENSKGEKFVYDFDYKKHDGGVKLDEYINRMFYEKENDQELEVFIYSAHNIIKNPENLGLHNDETIIRRLQ